MNCDELQQLTALRALGTLEAAERDRLGRLLESDPRAHAELARFSATVTALVADLPQVAPPPELRDQVLRSIRGKAQASPRETVPAAVPAVPAGFAFVPHDAPWLPAPLPGARFKLMSTAPDRDYAVLLIELQPGARYPEHVHIGTEEMYVLTGDLQTEGRLLGPGDFLHAEPGSHHHELYSPHGCTALMVAPLQALGSLASAAG